MAISQQQSVSSGLGNGGQLLVKRPSFEKVDEGELPDHQSDNRKENPAVSVVKPNYPTESVEPEQLSPD